MAYVHATCTVLLFLVLAENFCLVSNLTELHSLTLADSSYELLKFMRISYSYRMAKPYFGQHILTSFA